MPAAGVIRRTSGRADGVTGRADGAVGSAVWPGVGDGAWGNASVIPRSGGGAAGGAMDTTAEPEGPGAWPISIV
jgi:hypothetical protein